MAKKIVKSFISNNTVLIFASIFYFAIRFFNLTLLPIFNDEAIYLNWGWKELHKPGELFYSLLFGNQPMLMWVFGIAQSFFHDPLMAGRIVSVVIGFFSFLGIYTIGKQFFNRHIAILASFFYSIIPIFSFFDRQVLMESAISAIGIWSCYCVVKLHAFQEKKYAIALGALFGIGFFIKSNALIFVISFLLLQGVLFILKKEKRKQILQHTLLSVFITLLVDFPFLSHPMFRDGFFGVSSIRSLSLSELSAFPFLTWIATAKDAFEIGFWHITPFFFVFGLIGSLFITKTNDKNKQLVVYWFLVNSILLIVFSRNLYPRYIVSFLPLFSLFASYTMVLVWKKQKFLAVLFATFCSSIALWFMGLLIFSPMSYFSTMQHFTKFSQKGEYVTGWPSGYGIEETRKVLESLSKKRMIYVGVRPDEGNPESAMFAYFNSSKQIRPTHINSQIIIPWTKENCIQTNNEIYFIARDTQLAGLEKYIIEEIKRIYKPEHTSYISIYRLRTGCRNG